MKIPQIDYTSRDYLTLKDDLVKVVQNRVPEWQANEESDFTLALVEAFAYLGDNLSYYMDRAANEGSVQSATQLQNILNFAEVSGYHVSGPTPAYISLTFKNTSGSTLSLPIGTQVRGYVDTDTFTEIYFETSAPIASLANGSSATVTAFEGYVSNTLSSSGLDTNNLPLPVTLGTSSGYAYSEFVLPETGIIDLSVSVYTGQSSAFTKWTYVSNLAEYGPLDRVFTTRINADKTLSVLFGDGVNGKIPEVGTPISSLYRVSVGTYGNLSLTSPSLINPDGSSALSLTYVPGVSLSGVGSLATVTPVSASIGGTNGDMQEPYYSIRGNIRKALKTKNRAVTLKDYEDLAVLVPRVGRASATSSVYTAVNLYVQPLNDGSATPGRDSSGNELTTIFSPIRNAVLSFVGTRCPVNTTLNINPPTYVPVYLHMTVYIRDGFSQSSVQLDVGNLMLNSTTGLFSYNGYAFGEDVVLSAITYEIMRHPAVTNVIINGLGKISSGYYTKSISGTSGLSAITVDNNTGLVAGQLVYGTGIAAGTKISSVSGTTINLTNANIGAVSETGTFFTSAPADIPIASSEIPSLTSTYTTIVMSGGIS
jgi:hypothetical protein